MDCSPDRLLCPWDSPGKNTAVGRSFFSPGDFGGGGHGNPVQRLSTHTINIYLHVLLLLHMFKIQLFPSYFFFTPALLPKFLVFVSDISHFPTLA